MALSEELYDYLRILLLKRPIVYPQPATICGFRPEFLKCHVTADEVQRRWGWPMIVGIEFLDLHGKLYPWPHCVNERGGVLTDFSGGANQPFLGFIVTGHDQIEQFNAVVASYNDMLYDRFASRWSDPRAHSLSDEFLLSLQSSAKLPSLVHL